MLSTLPNPTIVLVIPLTVPVNVGPAKFAFAFNNTFNEEVISTLDKFVAFVGVFHLLPNNVVNEEFISTLDKFVALVGVFHLASRAVVNDKFISTLDKFVALIGVFHLVSNAVCVAFDIGLFKSLVLFILEMAVFGLGSTAPYLYAAKNRTGRITSTTLVESAVLIGKYSIMHIILQFTGFYGSLGL